MRFGSKVGSELELSTLAAQGLERSALGRSLNDSMVSPKPEQFELRGAAH
jgi:hypothetical protein